MGFIMRVYAKRKASKLRVAGIMVLLPMTAQAGNEYATTIKQAQVELQGGRYVLNAEINYNLSPAAKAALLKGIALSWTIPVVLQQRRSFFWPETVWHRDLRYQVQYFALLNVYRVKAEHTGQVEHFASLNAALNAVAFINALFIADKQQFVAGRPYQVQLKVKFEREALPIPLRPISYVDQEWYLSSDWWVVKL